MHSSSVLGAYSYNYIAVNKRTAVVINLNGNDLLVYYVCFSSLFYVEVSINGVYNGYRYNSDYAIPLSMTKTLTKLFEESQESSYAEFYSGTYLDPTTEKPIYIDSENGSSVDAITEAVFDCLATGELSFDSGEIHLCRYMEYDLTMSLASHEEDYVRFFTLISDYLETKRDATRENTVPVLIGIDMYSEGGSEARANAYSVMYLTEEEYDALLVAVYLKPAH